MNTDTAWSVYESKEQLFDEMIANKFGQLDFTSVSAKISLMDSQLFKELWNYAIGKEEYWWNTGYIRRINYANRTFLVRAYAYSDEVWFDKKLSIILLDDTEHNSNGQITSRDELFEYMIKNDYYFEVFADADVRRVSPKLFSDLWELATDSRETYIEGDKYRKTIRYNGIRFGLIAYVERSGDKFYEVIRIYNGKHV